MRRGNIHSYQRQYSSLIRDLKESLSSAKFYEWSRNKRQYFIARLLECIRRLQRLGVRVSLTTAFVSSLLVAGPSFSQPAALTGPCDPDPFAGITIDYDNMGDNFHIPVSGDLNGDGLEDLVIFSAKDEDYVRYFENSETGLTELTGDDSPFSDLIVEGPLPILRPDIGDMDGDGDNDILLIGGGDIGGDELIYLENNNGSFDLAMLPVSGEIGTGRGIFCDLDNDCDEDILYFGIITNDDDPPESKLSVLENVDGAFALSPAMSARYSQFNSTLPEDFSNLGMDLPDFRSGFSTETIQQLYEEVQTHAEDLQLIFDPMPPLSVFSYPSCLDVNGDGDLDLVALDVNPMGLKDPRMIRSGLESEDCEEIAWRYWEREGDEFVEVTGMDNPFNICDGALDEMEARQLFGHSFGDIDGDGQLNLYYSAKDGDAETVTLICENTEFSADVPCAVPTVPTMGEWGVIVLGLIMMIFSVVGIKQKKPVLNHPTQS